MLDELAGIVTPETILHWHRELVARNGDCSTRRKTGGPPAISAEIVELVLRLAKESPSWGYERTQDALANLGHRISDTTVARILSVHGIEPAPRRRRETTRKTFLKAHWDVLASVDFTTMDVWTRSGLVTYYLLFFIELATRRVHFAGLTPNPDEAWMLQVARNVTDAEEGFMRGKKYLLVERDVKFSEAFGATLREAGVEAVRLPPRSPEFELAFREVHGLDQGTIPGTDDLLPGKIAAVGHNLSP